MTRLGIAFTITLRAGIDHRLRVANPAGLCPIKTTPPYGVGVTTPAPEPTLADVLAAVNALSSKVDGIDNKTDDLIQATADGFAHVINELSTIKADVGDAKGDLAVVKSAVADIKVEMGLLEARVDDAHRAILRHANDPNAHPDAA